MFTLLCVESCTNIYSFLVSPDKPAKFGSKPRAGVQADVSWAERVCLPGGCTRANWPKADAPQAFRAFCKILGIQACAHTKVIEILKTVSLKLHRPDLISLNWAEWLYENPLTYLSVSFFTRWKKETITAIQGSPELNEIIYLDCLGRMQEWLLVIFYFCRVGCVSLQVRNYCKWGVYVMTWLLKSEHADFWRPFKTQRRFS